MLVTASWHQLKVSFLHPVGKRQWAMQFIWLTNRVIAKRPAPLSTVACPCQNPEPAARLTLRSTGAIDTVATSLLHTATKQLQKMAVYETNRGRS